MDISEYLGSGTLRFYIQVPRDIEIQIGVTDSKWNSALVTRKISASEQLSEIKISLAEIAASARNVDFSKIVQIRITPVSDATLNNGKFLKAGETMVLGPLQIWSKGAADIKLPGPFDGLTKTDETESIKLFETEYLNKNYWSDDWNSDRDRSINIDTIMLDEEDENYYKFKRASVISLNSELVDIYYENKYPAAFFGLNDPKDLTPYILTGTVRFWVKSSKTMTLDFALTDQKYSVVKISKKIEASEQFVEVQIPLKDFYLAAWESNSVFDWTQFYHFRVYPSSTATKENGEFLLAGDTLTFGYIQVWSKEAPEPSAEAIDLTRIFYDANSGAFIKDYDRSLLEGTELRFYRITDDKELNMLRAEIGSKSELNSAYGLLVITEGKKNDSALSEVDIYIPLTEELGADNIKFAVRNDSGEYTGVSSRKEDSYLVISTKDFGKLLAYSGEDIKSAAVENISESAPGKNADKINGAVIWIAVAAAVIIVGSGCTAVIIYRKKRLTSKK